jgi:hypothetical protein
MYDLRQATLAISALKEQLEAARAALQPRKKFSFNRKAAKSDNHGGNAQASGGKHAAGAEGGGGGSGGADEVASSLQRLLISNSASRPSGR